MIEWINQYQRRASKSKKAVAFYLDAKFAAKATRFAARESKRVGYKVSHSTMYQTLLENHWALPKEQEAHANNEDNKTSSRTTKEDPGIGTS